MAQRARRLFLISEGGWLMFWQRVLLAAAPRKFGYGFSIRDWRSPTFLFLILLFLFHYFQTLSAGAFFSQRRRGNVDLRFRIERLLFSHSLLLILLFVILSSSFKDKRPSKSKSESIHHSSIIIHQLLNHHS